MSARTEAAAGWVVSPAFDLLFLANVAWPLLLWPGLVTVEGGVPTEFWQIYFLTVPHRWLTLVLVTTDPDRREGRSGPFLGLAGAAAVLVGGVWLAFDGFLCLLLVDYIWNGWHFASQHAGVLRIYSRKVGGGPDWLERHGLRLFIFYAIARTAGWSTGWLEADPDRLAWLRAADLLVLTLPAALLGVGFARASRGQLGRLAYLTSVCLLYGGLVLALRQDAKAMVFALTAASSTFHAVEYLAIVTHYAWRRRTQGSAGLFRAMASRGLGLLALYALLLGSLGAWAVRQSSAWVELWQGLNLWAALLHYAYDGMIWKLRRPATARALGAVGE
jgi:hypothetical protein